MKFSEALRSYLDARDYAKGFPRESERYMQVDSAAKQLDEVIDTLGQAVLTHDENIKDIQKITNRNVL